MHTKNERINERIKEENNKIITNSINELDKITFETVSTYLPQQISEGFINLDHSVYEPFDPTDPEGVGRYLLYDNPDKSNPISIWIFAIASNQTISQTTSIHGHKHKGKVIVLEGPVTEKNYIPISKDTARLVSRVDRYRFHCNSDDLSEIFVHKLKRRKGLGEGISLTLHIYNMEAFIVNQEGKKIERRNVSSIYFKEKTKNKEDLPPYTQAHPTIKM